MIEYRLLAQEEMPAAVQFWVSVFGEDPQFFETLLAGGEPDDFSVAAFDSGKLVSSVHVFGRWFRDRSGSPLKVGGIGSVSTHPEARKKGHSGRLLEMAIQEMDQRQFIWSYLGTGVNDHYARYGWRTVSTPVVAGKLTGSGSSPTILAAHVDDVLLTAMAETHRVWTAKQPMANKRSDLLWKTAVRFRITQKTDEVYPAVVNGSVSAYVVCRPSEQGIEFVETTGPDELVSDIVTRRIGLAVSEGVRSATWSGPSVGGAYQAFVANCQSVWPMEERGWMARPIGDRVDWPTLAGILSDPRGRRSQLDNF